MYVDWILLAKDRVLLTCCCKLYSSKKSINVLTSWASLSSTRITRRCIISCVCFICSRTESCCSLGSRSCGNWKPFIEATLLQLCRLTCDANDIYLYRRAYLCHTGAETLVRCYIVHSRGLDALCAGPGPPPRPRGRARCSDNKKATASLCVVFY
jgi:hypothetical protein